MAARFVIHPLSGLFSDRFSLSHHCSLEQLDGLIEILMCLLDTTILDRVTVDFTTYYKNNHQLISKVKPPSKQPPWP